MRGIYWEEGVQREGKKGQSLVGCEYGQGTLCMCECICNCERTIQKKSVKFSWLTFMLRPLPRDPLLSVMSFLDTLRHLWMHTTIHANTLFYSDVILYISACSWHVILCIANYSVTRHHICNSSKNDMKISLIFSFSTSDHGVTPQRRIAGS